MRVLSVISLQEMGKVPELENLSSSFYIKQEYMSLEGRFNSEFDLSIPNMKSSLNDSFEENSKRICLQIVSRNVYLKSA